MHDCRGMKQQLESLRNLLRGLDAQLYAFLESKESLNMLFCFRWILVLFKREFPFDKILRLWDAFFVKPETDLHLFMALAILFKEKKKIMDMDLNFDGLMEYCINLSGNINLERTLAQAEYLYQCAVDAGLVVS